MSIWYFNGGLEAVVQGNPAPERAVREGGASGLPGITTREVLGRTHVVAGIPRSAAGADGRGRPDEAGQVRLLKREKRARRLRPQPHIPPVLTGGAAAPG